MQTAPSTVLHEHRVLAQSQGVPLCQKTQGTTCQKRGRLGKRSPSLSQKGCEHSPMSPVRPLKGHHQSAEPQCRSTSGPA